MNNTAGYGNVIYLRLTGIKIDGGVFSCLCEMSSKPFRKRKVKRRKP